MDAQMHKIMTNRQTNHEKKRSRKLAHGNDKTRSNTSPPKLDFWVPSNKESQFQLFHICWECVPNGVQSHSKLRSAGAFGAKNLQKRGFKTTQKISIRKVRKYVKNVPQKGTPKSGRFVVFRGLEPKASQGGPKDPPELPTRSNLVEICTKKGARNWISVMFYWVLSQTEPTCPQVLPRCFQIIPDASRVLIRVICKELPTRRQEKTNKNK